MVSLKFRNTKSERKKLIQVLDLAQSSITFKKYAITTAPIILTYKVQDKFENKFYQNKH